MHFKIVVLFCALNFFTAAWGFGLNDFHIYGLVDLFVNKQIPDHIDQYLSNLRFADEQLIFTLKTTLEDDETMSQFLISLANSDKESFDWEGKSLSTFEVKLFVTMFNKQDQTGEPDGFLTRDEFNELIKTAWYLKKLGINEQIQNEFHDENSVHVLQYFVAIVKYKPLGNGLDKGEIEKCHYVYSNSTNHLDSSLLQMVFETLNIGYSDHPELLEFRHARPAAHELIELLVFWSEYNEEVRDPFLTTDLVRTAMWQFTFYDKNKDGKLDYGEFNNFAIAYEEEYLLEKFSDFSVNGLMCAAQFLLIK